MSGLIIRITLHSWWLSWCLHCRIITLRRSGILRIISWYLARWRSALALAIAKLAGWPSWWLLIVGRIWRHHSPSYFLAQRDDYLIIVIILISLLLMLNPVGFIGNGSNGQIRVAG